MKKLFVLLFLGILSLATAAHATVLTARFSFEDGSPVTGQIVIFRVATPSDEVVGTYRINEQGYVSSDITLEPTANYRAQLVAPNGTILQELWTISPSSAIVAAALEMLGSGEVDVVLTHTGRRVKSVVFVPFATTLNFDNPTPPGDPGSPLVGLYKDVDWGSENWVWDSSGLNSSSNIYFQSGLATSGSFSFTQPRILLSIRLFSLSDGTLTLSSDRGETKTLDISAGQTVTVSTGWTNPARQVTVTFTSAGDLGIEQIVYQ